MSASEILAGLVGWVAGVASIVVGERLNAYFNRLKMNVVTTSQIITNTPTKHSEVLGYGITIEQGDLDEAYARFNKTVYPWWENGKSKAKTQLLVGDEPSYIFPYYMTLEYIEDVSKQTSAKIIKGKGDPSNHAVQFSIFELAPDKNTTTSKIFERIIIMPKNAKTFTISINELLSKICIRLIAKGIKKKMQYTGDIKIKSLSIGKLENGVPYLDTSIVNMILYYE
jgi:hypothetical protein